jgi:hypothetical protein
MGVCGVLSTGEESFRGLKACFALVKISFALATLLLRFLSVLGDAVRFDDVAAAPSLAGFRSGDTRSLAVVVLEAAVESRVFAFEADEGDTGLAMVVSPPSSALPGAELPNILFRRPAPWLEKLRRFWVEEEASLGDGLLDAAPRRWVVWWGSRRCGFCARGMTLAVGIVLGVLGVTALFPVVGDKGGREWEACGSAMERIWNRKFCCGSGSGSEGCVVARRARIAFFCGRCS